MPNMSYCRFQNTREDLRDCELNMNEGDLSYDEARARRSLITLCVRIAENYGDEIEEPFPSRAEYEG